MSFQGAFAGANDPAKFSGGLRPVALTGTAQLNILVGNVFNYEGTIKAALESAGWNISAVRITKQTLFTNQINITIEANVDSAYTAEQARQNATQLLSTIPGESYAYVGSSLLSNVSLQVLRDGTPSNASQDATNNDAVSTILNAVGNTALNTVKDSTVGLTKNPLFPVALIGFAVVGLLYFGPRGK